MAETSHRRVSYSQLEQLYEILDKNRQLALGYNKTSQAREFCRKMWESIAENLNSHANGAVKDWRGWCKYWNDYKCKIKKLAAATRAAQNLTGGGAPQVRSMSEIERKFLSILGADFGSGLPGVRIEPFNEISQERVLEIETSDRLIYLTAPLPLTPPLPSTAPLTATASLLSTAPLPSTAPLLSTAPLPSTVPLPSTAPLSSIISVPSTSPMPSGAEDIIVEQPPTGQTPRRTPRRRRRRETPMGQEAARRALIRISERRMQIEERNSETLVHLLQELKEIKQILQSRSSGHSIDDE